MKFALVAEAFDRLEDLEQWAVHEGLTVVDKSGVLVKIDAELAAVEKAFGVHFEADKTGWHTTDKPRLPEGSSAVSGLSTKGRVYPHYKQPVVDPTWPQQVFNNPEGVSPEAVASAYQVSGPYTGTGRTIGIAEWGCSWQQADIDGFTTAMKLPSITPTTICIDGYVNTFNAGDGPEATLDIQWAHAMAPDAAVRVYMAPGGSTDTAWALQVTNLLNEVLKDPVVCDVLSISYGDAEDQFVDSDIQAWEAVIKALVARGTTVVVSSGDTGAYAAHELQLPQIQRVAAPASCPSAFAVGGTALYMNLNTVEDEWAWSNDLNWGASTGGYSSVFSAPPYQSALKVSMRGVPDVAAIASTATMAYMYYDGNPTEVAGTSLAAPIVAGLLTRVTQATGKPLGDVHEAFYTHGDVLCRDIPRGNNTCFAVAGFNCCPGWDAVTGWGSPQFRTWPKILGGGGAATGMTYTVQKGDTLWSIASTLLDVNTQLTAAVQAIEVANPTVHPTALAVGTVLTIPRSVSTTAHTTVVQAGDTLWGLAEALLHINARIATAVAAIEAANPTVKPADLAVGTVLQIPKGV